MRARWPMAIHVTFQYGGMPARIRLRQAAALLRLICDWGMWLVDDEPSTRARPRLTAASTSTNGKYDPQGVGACGSRQRPKLLSALLGASLCF